MRRLKVMMCAVGSHKTCFPFVPAPGGTVRSHTLRRRHVSVVVLQGGAGCYSALDLIAALPAIGLKQRPWRNPSRARPSGRLPTGLPGRPLGRQTEVSCPMKLDFSGRWIDP